MISHFQTPASTLSCEAAISGLCDGVMRSVVDRLPTALVRTAQRRDNDFADIASRICREEIKAFLFSAEYADARDCIMRGSIPAGYVISLVAATCVEKIVVAIAS